MKNSAPMKKYPSPMQEEVKLTPKAKISTPQMKRSKKNVLAAIYKTGE